MDSKSEELRPTGGSELCDACQKITLENLGCFPEGLPNVLKSTDDFDDYAGYEYPHTVGDLDKASKRCKLCALLLCIVYQGGDLETILTRDKTSRIKLAYHQFDYFGVSKDYPSRACFRVLLSKPFKDGTRGNYAPLFLRVYTKPEDEQKLAQLGFGRQVVPADSEVAFQRVLSNLNDCIKNHAVCARTIEGLICNETSTLPSRLIDLGTKPEDVPLLVETARSNGKYIALSYCWGKVSEPLKLETTTSTIDSFKKSLPLDNIPKTIRHAMAITKRLGFRYLWVDRLCILQDNKADWQTEAQKMGRIYEGAVCTIAAVGAKDSGDGCFLPRQEENAVTLPLETGTLFVSHPMVPVDFPTQETNQSAWEMVNSAWSTRAWVFQERLFSRRMILYGKMQIFWECRMHLDSETRFGHDAGYTYNSGRYQYSSDFKRHINKQIFKALQESPSSSSPINPIGPPSDVFNWGDIIAQYSQMKLTYEGDRLPVMDGLAQVVQQQTKLEVGAGMWLGSLSQSLFWWPFWWDEREIERSRRQFPLLAGTKGLRPVRLSNFEAPSWSWLAAGTPVSFYPFFKSTVLGIERPKFLYDNIASNTSSQPAPKLEIWAHTITANRTTGQVFPTINKSLTEKWNKVPPNNFTGILDRWEADGIYALIHYEDSEKYDGLVLFDDPESAPLSFDCVIVGAGPGVVLNDDRLTVYFLMIQPTANPRQYKRLGIGFRCLVKDSDYLEHIPPKQCIILV